jgi:hypothetical protein
MPVSWFCQLIFSSDVFTWRCHLKMSCEIVIWCCHAMLSCEIVVWCFFFWCCHAMLSCTIVIWRFHMMLPYDVVMCDCHLMFLDDVVMWYWHVWCFYLTLSYDFVMWFCLLMLSYVFSCGGVTWFVLCSCHRRWHVVLSCRVVNKISWNLEKMFYFFKFFKFEFLILTISYRKYVQAWVVKESCFINVIFHYSTKFRQNCEISHFPKFTKVLTTKCRELSRNKIYSWTYFVIIFAKY